MLGLGTIGTSFITPEFIDAALKSERYQLVRVYSRHADSAQELAAKYNNAAITTDLEELFHDDRVDVVYVASPNSLHFEQAKAALLAGKHVIIEKPVVQSEAELKELLDIANEKGKVVVEAARHVFEPNFQAVKQKLSEHDSKPWGATLSYAKYSSRIDDFFAGKTPNIFTKKFAGGALNDLGIYLVYAAVAWFGAPDRATYVPQHLGNGIDGSGMMALTYPTFNVYLHVAKDYTTYDPAEIYFGKETWRINHIQMIDETAEIINKDGSSESLGLDEVTSGTMDDEAQAFATFIEQAGDPAVQKQYAEFHNLMIKVIRVMDELRTQS
ncbi:MAG: Gfo/Idh/MocA family oxidoreductase [Aerococcus sp.]|nr:Gfo/Idh/MocA family oxidoreductase [Aerococcus sp.]